jgi:hypothetical protein
MTQRQVKVPKLEAARIGISRVVAVNRHPQSNREDFRREYMRDLQRLQAWHSTPHLVDSLI